MTPHLLEFNRTVLMLNHKSGVSFFKQKGKSDHTESKPNLKKLLLTIIYKYV